VENARTDWRRMLRPNRRLVWMKRKAYGQKHAGRAKRDEKRVPSS
jgi:hypothetical protein